MNTTVTRTAGALGAGLLALTLVGAGSTAAEAKGRVVAHSGSCSASAHWKLKAQADDGRLEVQFEVDANRVGQTWAVRMSDNSHRFFSGKRTTAGPSGSFSVTRRPVNRAGSDRVRAVATNTKSGQTCSGVVVF
jgi:hypothetical protein